MAAIGSSYTCLCSPSCLPGWRFTTTTYPTTYTLCFQFPYRSLYTTQPASFLATGFGFFIPYSLPCPDSRTGQGHTLPGSQPAATFFGQLVLISTDLCWLPVCSSYPHLYLHTFPTPHLPSNLPTVPTTVAPPHITPCNIPVLVCVLLVTGPTTTPAPVNAAYLHNSTTVRRYLLPSTTGSYHHTFQFPPGHVHFTVYLYHFVFIAFLWLLPLCVGSDGGSPGPVHIPLPATTVPLQPVLFGWVTVQLPGPH